MPLNRDRLLKLTTLASVLTGVTLLLFKVFAWQATDSVSILASLVDSLMDISASIITLFAVRISLKPADHNHSFGHGKAEALAGLGQSLFIASSAFFLFVQAIDRFRAPQDLVAIDWGVGTMVLSIVITACLTTLQRYTISQTNSPAIKADYAHYLTDIVTNSGTLLALVFAAFGANLADPIIAIMISIYILYSAAQIFMESVHQLMDHELPEAERALIEQTVLAQPDVLGIHELRTWQTGSKKIMQFHLELNRDISLVTAHSIIENVERAILNTEPDADITIHPDPV